MPALGKREKGRQTLTSLSGEVFDYIARTCPGTLQILLRSLAQAGDVASIQAALSAGHARLDPTNRAIAVLELIPARTSPGTGQSNYAERLRLVHQWLVEAAGGHTSELGAKILSRLEEEPEDRLRDYVPVIARLGYDFSSLELTSETSIMHGHFGDCSAGVLHTSEVTKQISLGNLNLAMAMAGPIRDHFPVTMLLRAPDGTTIDTRNLVEQVVLSCSPVPSWPKIMQHLAPAPEALLFELGDLVLRLARVLQQPGDTGDTAQSDGMVLRLRASGLGSELGKRQVLGHIVALLAHGALLRSPRTDWQTLRDAVYPGVGISGFQRVGLPIWASFLALSEFETQKDDTARMLTRMVTEGGLSPDVELLGHTLLQLAARFGKADEARTLLNLGAAQDRCGSVCRDTPAELAQQNKHHDIVAMLSAHKARRAITSVQQASRNTP